MNFTIKAIRGAISVDKNTKESIKKATVELLSAILEENNIELSQISHIFFTMTKDLDAAYPAKFAREELNFNNIPMMCYQELEIKNSLPLCLRTIIIINSDIEQTKIKHIYLKEAKKLRPDIV